EVHDVVAHSVSVMVALADGAGAIAATSPAEAQSAMREVAQTGRAALADMKRVLTALADAPAADDGEDLATMVARFRLAGLPVVTSGLDAVPTEATVALACRRIVAESLTNVLRHAPGTQNVRVAVVRDGGDVVVEVVNGPGTGDGGCYDGTGRGVRGMHERAQWLGGDWRPARRPTAAGRWSRGCRWPWRRDARGTNDDDRAAGRRPRAAAQGLPDGAAGRAGPRGGGRGGRRPGRRRAGPRPPTRRRAHGRADARWRRHHRDRADRRGPPGHPRAGADDARPRRVRVRRAARRSERLPAQERRARRAGRGDPHGRPR